MIDKVYKRKNLEIAWERARLRARVQELEAEVDQLKRENLDLQREVDELRARLGMRRPRLRRND